MKFDVRGILPNDLNMNIQHKHVILGTEIDWF